MTIFFARPVAMTTSRSPAAPVGLRLPHELREHLLRPHDGAGHEVGKKQTKSR